jgi:hypothetical protein
MGSTSKKHGSTKRKTVHLVLWVKPIVKQDELQGRHIPDTKQIQSEMVGLIRGSEAGKGDALSKDANHALVVIL